MDENLSDDDLLDQWEALATDYAAVPGREKWEQYSNFIYTHECDLIRIIRALRAKREP